jgi:hypothetical protein
MESPRLPPRRSLRLLLAAAMTFGAGLLLYGAELFRASERAPLSFALENVPAEESGIAFVHRVGRFSPAFANIRPFLQAVSASACVSDIDNDGWPDLYLTTAGDGERNQLYVNRGGLRFIPVRIDAIERVNDDGFSSDCVFADVNNDGFDDLFLVFISHGPRLFLNVADGSTRVGRTFRDVTADAGLPSYMNGGAVSFLDVERDGDLDLLLASYFSTHYKEVDVPGSPRIHATVVPAAPGAGRIMPNNFGNATNGGRKHLLLNDGSGRFADQDLQAWGLGGTRFTLDIGTGDVNGDGWTDVYYANDFGPDQLYYNRGGRHFEQIRGWGPASLGRDSFKGMNAELADLDSDGYPEIFVSNVYHPLLPEGSMLWQNRQRPGGPPTERVFENVALRMGVKDGGWGWGARFVDLDLDADLDLVASTGFISQSREREYWYRLSRIVAGSGSLIVDSRNWPPFDDRSMSGFQTPRVFVREAHSFYDRAEGAGIRDWRDSRGVAEADFDLDGRGDLVIVTQGGAPQLLRNRHVSAPTAPAAPGYIGLKLVGDGRIVSRNAVGTKVSIRPLDAGARNAFKPIHREISSGNGMSAQSSSWILAGLGQYSGRVAVRVGWPNGHVQNLDAVDTNRYVTIVYDGN